jgi:putative oxidoreductase
MQIRQSFHVSRDISMTSVGLLVLRASVGLGIFIKPGIERLTGYFSGVQHFPTPIHIAADDPLAYALLAHGICTLLLLLGLFTRPVALMSLIEPLVTFMIGHQAAFVAEGHPELVFLYIGGLLMLLITGPGRYSADSWISPRHFDVTPKEWEHEQFIEAEFPGLPWQSVHIMPF